MMSALFFNQLGWPILVWAQTTEPTPTVEEQSPTPTETPVTPTPTTTPETTPTPTEIPVTPTPTVEISPTATPTGTMQIVPVTPTTAPAATVVVVVSNEAEVNNDSQSLANTGGNTIDNNQPGETTPTPTAGPQGTSSMIVTDKAIALANIVNAVNTTSIGSSVKIYLLNNVNGAVGQIDLNTAWGLLNSNGDNMNVLTIDTTGQNNHVLIDNLGIIQNQVEVTANTGGNQISGGNNSSIFTGNAYALANVMNLLNLNLINSRFFMGVINVDGSTLGDIVLPNPENFLNSSGGQGGIEGAINNLTNIDSQAAATAESGHNSITTTGDGLILTGNSQSAVNILTSSNLTLSGNNQLLVGLNILGNWSGNIYNFYGLGSSVGGGNYNLFTIDGNSQENDKNTINTTVNNTAAISNMVLAQAMSGNNTINSSEGQSIIQTGSTWSLANIANLANLNLFNSNWFYMTINVVGDWGGNLIFAYPDLMINLSLANDLLKIGDETQVTVNYANVGYDDTNDTNKIQVDLPLNLEYLDDNSGLSLSKNGNSLVWQVSDMPAKSSRSFTIKVRLTKEESTAWRLVKTAMAAEAIARSEVVINGNISTSKTEVSTDNNRAQAVAYVNVDGSNNQSNLLPKIVITEKNNVNNWVYKNDVVSFEMGVKNEGEATAYNSYLVQKVFDSYGNLITQNKIKLGNIVVGKSGKVTFGLPISFNMSGSQTLISESMVTSVDENNNEVESNISQSSFLVKFGEVRPPEQTVVSQVQTADNFGEILGTSATNSNNYIWLYLLLFTSSSVWILRQARKWQSER